MKGDLKLLHWFELEEQESKELKEELNKFHAIIEKQDLDLNKDFPRISNLLALLRELHQEA